MYCDITNYGAVPNTGTINTEAIQAAIDDCSRNGGGTVNVPCGVFVTGTIYLRSNVELYLQHGAELQASIERADYNALDAYPENFSVPFEGWEGLHLIIAHNCENVAITGLGKINGSADRIFDEKIYYFDFSHIWSYGIQYQKDFHYRMENPPRLRPGQTVVFVDCRNVSITDVTIVNSPAWCLFLHGCQEVKIRGYKAFNKNTWANTDGLDIDTCRNVVVSDCIIDTGDDAVAIRCDAEKLRNGMVVCENVTISNCIFSSSSSVFRLGIGVGQVRNILISNIIIHRGGIAFDLATTYEHTTIEDVSISNIFAENISIPFSIVQRDDCYVKNIVFSNYRAKSFAGVCMNASRKGGIENISVRDMHLSIIPPPFPREVLNLDGGNYLVAIENAEDVRFDNFKTDFSQGREKLFVDYSPK